MHSINRALLTAGLIAMMQTPVSFYKTIEVKGNGNKQPDFEKQKAAEEKRKRRQLRNLRNK